MTEEREPKKTAESLKEELLSLSTKIELEDNVLNEAYELVDSFSAEAQLCSYKNLTENLKSWSLSFALFASWRQNKPLTFKELDRAGLDIFQLLGVCRKLSNSFTKFENYAGRIATIFRTLSHETLIQRRLYDIFPKLFATAGKYRDLNFLERDSKQLFNLNWILLLYMKKILKKSKLIDCSIEISSLYNLSVAAFCILTLEKTMHENPSKRQRTGHEEVSVCELERSQVDDLCHAASGIEEDVVMFISLMRRFLPNNFLSFLPVSSLSVVDELREALVREFEGLGSEDLETCSFDELQIFCSLWHSSENSFKGNSFQPEKELHVLASLASGNLNEGSSGYCPRLDELSKLAKLYFGDTSKLELSTVTSSLLATTWLREISRMRPEISFQDDENRGETTSTTLRLFCERCDANTYKNMIEFASNLVFSFLENNQWYGEEVLEERKKEILGLYFYVLEKVLLSEERRLHRQNFGSLLGNQCLHRSLIACSIVASLGCYGCQDRYLFISVLHGINISPFEYTKSVGSFVMSVEDIPRNVQKFLVKIEEISVECICWQDASVVDYLEKSLADIDSLAAGADNSPFRPLDLYDKNVLDSVPYSIIVFFRKLLRIASEKVRDFCSRMQVSNVFEELVLVTVNYALTRHFHLLVNRHVDVIVMCSLYAVSKVAQEHLKFNDIAAFYRQIFQRKGNHLFDIEENLCRVYLEENSYGDIIEFYNRNFIKHFRSFLLEYVKAMFEERVKAHGNENEKDPGGPSTPVRPLHSKVVQSPSGSDTAFYTPSPVVRTSPSRKIGKVTISPMSPEGRRQMARRTPMTPKTKALYAFGESPNSNTMRSYNSSETGVAGIDENLQGAKPLSFNWGSFGRYNNLVPILISSDGRPPLPPQERSSS